MYGSYGSYSSMCAAQMATPMDIYPSRNQQQRQQDSTTSYCAFPSWPRRASLSEESEQRASSFLSDEDLLPGDVFEDSDDSHSVSSAGSSNHASPPTEAELLALQREREAYQREVVRLLLNEKEQRRRQQHQLAKQQQQRQRRGSAGSKKSPKRHSAMPPIAEAGSE